MTNLSNRLKKPISRLYEHILPYEVRFSFYKLRNEAAFNKLRSEVFPSDKGDFSLMPFDELECIFVHITKTAGTSIAKGLFGYLPYHYTAQEYRVIYGKKTFEDYYKFCFVRNPWDRLASAFNYLRQGGWNAEDERFFNENLRLYSFEKFVLEWINEESILTHLHFWPQNRFVCDRRGKLIVDHVARFEDIADEFAQISSKLGINAKLPHTNSSSTLDYRSLYSNEMIDTVAKLYQVDIALLNYEFE